MLFRIRKYITNVTFD